MEVPRRAVGASVALREALDDRTSYWIRVGAVTALGAIALGFIGFITYRGLNDADTPPRIEVEARDVREAAGLYLVRFRAINRGGETGGGLRDGHDAR